MSSEIACLEEIRGRCTAIRVNFPDTDPRMQSATAAISDFLSILSKRPINDIELRALEEELTDLRGYLQYVINEAKETKTEIDPCIKAIDWMFEPIHTKH